jgi:subtilisin-like proprotein convertase family protein
MKKFLQFLFLYILIFLSENLLAQLNNNCSNAIQVCNNQLAEQLDDGIGIQECPSGGCGCMLAGEKNTRWFKIVIAPGGGGTLEFTIRPYSGTADYDFSLWNQGSGGACPTGGSYRTPDRCNFAAPKSPTGIRGTGNGNSNTASGNLFSNNMTVAAGDVLYLLVDNYDGTQEGFYLDFFGGAPGSGTGTTAKFDCSGVNSCTSCNDADCKTYYFASPDDYSFDETAANGGCHSNFGYASVKTATVCGTFTVPSPFTTVEFPTNRGYEIITTNGANTTTCLNSANITYQVWDSCASAPLTPSSPGIYNGLNNSTSYKVCKTITVTGADCWLSRICLPYWTEVANDVICNATNLTIDAAPTSGTNAGASSDLDAGCTGYNDVYYKFTAPLSGRVQVNVVPNASSDVKVSLIGPMAGLDGGVNDCNLTCMQLGESNVVAGCNDNAGTGGTERLFSFVIPGQTYYIWISGTLFRPNATFTVQVVNTITSNAIPTPGPDIVGAPDPIPSNDQCANATNLNLCVALPSSNIGATAECTDPDPEYVDALTLENDVWYKWTAPANNGNSEVTLTVTGVSCTAGEDGSTGIQFGIFRGSCASLTPISHGTTSITFTPVAGQTYYFVIDGNAGAQCSYTIQVKRPIVTGSTCNTASSCAGSSLNATMSVTYYGTNPGTRWAYCKSSTFGTPCNSINLDDPTTYSIYNPSVGLPDPGCTPATYTFIGYILADNGVSTIPGYPSYPLPQPLTASCARSTAPCTFNIYPKLSNYVTYTADGCSQVVTVNASCPAALNVSGTLNQSVAVGTVGGNFGAVTVSWNAPYNTGSPAACNTLTIQTPIYCPSPSSDGPCIAKPLIVGGASVAADNLSAVLNANEQIACGARNSSGYGVWFSFVAPPSGNVNVNLTGVGSVNNLDAQIFWVSSRKASVFDCNIGQLLSDVCSACTDFNTACNLIDHAGFCADNPGANLNETLQLRGLFPGETNYIMVDGYQSGTTSERQGNFTIQVVDAGGGPTRPVNDNCTGAIDISNIACGKIPATNKNATSLCSGDPSFTPGSTENSVWYYYIPPVTGSYTISYANAKGYDCLGHIQNSLFPNPSSANGAGIQFALYTSNTNDCNGTFTELPTSALSTGAINGQITLNLTGGQKYYILIDGFVGFECDFEFKINSNVCCAANLGAVEKGDTILCYGEQTTLGVTADPINFGSNAEDNPVIGWLFSPTQPTGASLDPFDPSNASLGYFPGQIDIITPGTAYTDTTEVYEENISRSPSGGYASTSLGYFDTPIYKDINVSGFPAGANLQNVNNIKVCVYFGFEDIGSHDVTLISPSGATIDLFSDVCNESSGGMSVCFTAAAPTTIGSTCLATGGSPQAGALNNELKGDFKPEANFSPLVGTALNGTWSLKIDDDDIDGEGFWFFGWTIDLLYTQSAIGPPVVGPRHGDLTIINNDPFKYGPQEFWLTPVTMIDYDPAVGFTGDPTCYDYGPPTKITLLEKVTTPLVAATCAAPGDGSNGVSLTVTSPTGGLPGLPGIPANGTLNFSNNTPLVIPTATTMAWTNRDINVTGFTAGATLTANTNITVCLTFNPEHTYADDLDVQLIAPNGQILQLFSAAGGSNDLNGQYCFAISGAVLLSAAGVTGGNINTGTYDWSGNYNNINGTLLNGLWRLQIRDVVTGDGGTLTGWTLSLTGLVPTASTVAYTVIGSGAASTISFPSPPVQESEVSNPFTVLDGQAWNVRFVDGAGCESEIGGTYNQPNLGQVVIDTSVCDGGTVAFSTSNPIPLFSQYKVLLDFDSYPQDVSWFIYDGNNQIVASGGGYGVTVGANTTITPATINPNDGPFRFVLYDGYDDGFGSGGGSTNNGGSSTVNFIKIVEVHADGTVDTLFSKNYSYCSPIYCVGPVASVFSQVDVNLGTPTGTFATGVAVTLENNRTCTGTTVAGAITVNSNGSGTVNTTSAGINPGSSYSLQYSYTDQYGCVKTICGPIDVFPPVSINPTINCATNPPTVSVNASCPGCNATYIAEYSYNGGATWTTATSANFQDIYTFAHVKNVLTGVVSCEVSSVKLADCPTVLPIELIYIVASPIDNEYIKISWATASETNTRVFEVLRSTDAINFVKIGEVNAAGNSNSTKTYAYNDHNVSAGIIYYYVVREVDIDSKSHLTNIVNSRLEKAEFELISIYPNPTVDNTTITMYTKEAREITLMVYNDIGEMMKKEQKSLKEGLNEWNVETEKWAKGVYYFIINNGDKPVTKQVIKLN